MGFTRNKHAAIAVRAIAEASAGTVGSSAAGAGQEFKLQDGLMFNALNAGNRISYTVEDVGGLKTVTKVKINSDAALISAGCAFARVAIG